MDSLREYSPPATCLSIIGLSLMWYYTRAAPPPPAKVADLDARYPSIVARVQARTSSKDKSKESSKQAGGSLKALGWWKWAYQFTIFWRNVWPASRFLRLRAFVCFCGVLAESFLTIWLSKKMKSLLSHPWPSKVSFTEYIRESELLFGSGVLLVGINTFNGLFWVLIVDFATRSLRCEAYERTLKMDTISREESSDEKLALGIKSCKKLDDLLYTAIFKNFLPWAKFVCLMAELTSTLSPYTALVTAITCWLYLQCCILSTSQYTPKYDNYATAEEQVEKLERRGIRGWNTIWSNNDMAYTENIIHREVVESMISRHRSLRDNYCTFTILLDTIKSSGFYITLLTAIRSGGGEGELFLLGGYWLSLFGSIHANSGLFRTLTTNLLVVESSGLLALFQRPQQEEGDTEFPVAAAIEVTNASLARKGQQIINNLSLLLDIQPGARTAFVGRSGAGKTSLAKLLCGYNNPDSGRVSVGGIDMRRIIGKE
jgi:ABC-type multidrug transport system fused ATPase/permease subunit